MNFVQCRHCDGEFDPKSSWKKEVGGYINECPNCVEEMGGDPAPVVRGFVTGEGKMADIQILKFKNKSDAEKYAQAWNENSGWSNKHSGGLNDISFEKVAEMSGNRTGEK
jgi:hypothetical protein